MKFGVREVCDCAFTSLDGKTNFTIDTAKMSTLESASTTVYAQGGRGFSRLAAWEGERTLTFTVEDALLTTESFQALLGKVKTTTENGYSRYKLTTTDFAGYYRVTAQTLFRDTETGEDYAAVITIPKAKLQSNISLSMAPTGDPSAFTFTFDAFNDGSGELCYIDVAENSTGINTAVNAKTTMLVYKQDGSIVSMVDTTASTDNIILSINNKTVKLGSGSSGNSITLKDGEQLTDMRSSIAAEDTSTIISVPRGSTTTWFII